MDTAMLQIIKRMEQANYVFKDPYNKSPYDYDPNYIYDCAKELKDIVEEFFKNLKSFNIRTGLGIEKTPDDLSISNFTLVLEIGLEFTNLSMMLTQYDFIDREYLKHHITRSFIDVTHNHIVRTYLKESK